MTTRTRLAIAGTVVLLLCGAVPALASGLPPAGPPVAPPSPTGPTDLGPLDGAHPVLSFAGSVDNPTPLPLVDSPVPPACARGCHEYTFTAPGGTGFLVGVRDAVESTDDGYDLYVYGPDGTLAAGANGIGSNGQAVEIDDPAHGAYTVVVSYTYAYEQGAGFDGDIRLLAGPSWQPAAATCGITVGTTTGCFLLPRLRAVPAADLHVDGLPPVASTPLGFPLPVAPPTTTSCYADETFSVEAPSVDAIQHPVTRCLRFTSDVENVGSGRLDVLVPWLQSGAGAPSSGFLPGECQAAQVVHTASGDAVTRPAGPCEFHPAHGHFHYRDLISFTLYAVAADGSVGGQVGTSLKESFCLADDDYFGFATPGPNGPRTYVGQPGCNLPGQQPSGVAVTEGITPGWGDVYTWDTPDQFIDVTSVPPGVYDLVERTNPSERLLVAGPQQTCSLTQLELTATGVRARSSDDDIPCPAG